MKNLIIALLLLGALTIHSKVLYSNEVDEINEIDEIIVNSSYIDTNLSDLDDPIHVIAGDDVIFDSTLSLGESLDSLLGVQSSDFGSAVGHPVIRGLSGSRVKKMNNGRTLRDVSSIGDDHMDEVDLNDIQQIEIVRGPSSLLYSSGTVGGIINIIDNTIAREDFEKMNLNIGLETQSVNDGEAGSLSYQNNVGGFNLSFAIKDSQFDNFDIPNGAILHSEEEHHDEEGHEENLGYLLNSDFESTSKRFGISKTGDWGYFGFSYKNSESLFGVPFHGEGYGGHEEKAHHDEDEHHEEGEHEGERIFSNTESDVFDFEGSHIVNNSWLKKINYFFRSSEYLQTEQHSEEDHGDEDEHHDEEEHNDDDEHDEHGHAEGPTNFKNEAKEFGIIFDISNDLLDQKLSLNYAEEEISIFGSEMFMRPSDNEEFSVGYYASKDFGTFHLDLGLRYDDISRKGSVAHHKEEHHDEDEHNDEEYEEEIDYFNKDFSKTSFALGLSREIKDNLTIGVGFSRVERAPSASELFMNGPHLATGRYEVGNTNLKSETANNIDLNVFYKNNNFSFRANIFTNYIDNYIYLKDESGEEHDEHEEEHDDHGGLILANYLQRDAELEGYEFEVSQLFEFDRGNLTLSLGRDSVTGEFSNGSNIPRIVPARNILSVSYSGGNLLARLTYKDIEKQNDIGEGEVMTEAYEMLDFSLRKSFTLSNQNQISLSLFGKNLLDEVARNHSSFVKNEVPLPGRNFGMKLNYKF